MAWRLLACCQPPPSPHAIQLEGSRVDAQAAANIAKEGYCRHLQDPALREAGFYLHGDKLWIVLAAPFAP